MIDIVLKKDKTIRRTKHEDIYEGENKISWINVYLPETINDINIQDYNIVLRCYINVDNYIPYTLDTTKSINKIDITHEFTDKDRYIDAYLYITRADEVIGKTNTISFRVNKAKDGSGLTPREQFDEVIAEQRAEIAEQAETISTQGETITQQTEQITELNGEVSTLEGTVAEQQATITRQNTTIDELNERRTPIYIPAQLESKLITPKDTTEYYSPSEGKDGFSAVTVEGATVEGLNLNEDYYKLGEPFLDKVGKYNPFPENSYGGIYFTEIDEDNYPVRIKFVNYNGNGAQLNANAFYGFDLTLLRSKIKSFNLFNCQNINIANNLFSGSPLLNNVDLSGVVQISGYAFNSCPSLEEIIIPNSVISLADAAFGSNSNLKTLLIPNSLISVSSFTFLYDRALQNVTIEQGFNCNGLNLSVSTLYSQETIVSWLEALADRTGETAYTLTIGTTNLNKLTNEQKAIATNKNWNLA